MADPGKPWGGVDALRNDMRDAKRRLILREAGALFSELGYHNTSMEQIAARLGLTKTSLYYYFPDKSQILMRCFDLGHLVAEDALVRAREQGSNGLERTSLFIRFYVEGITSELGACATALELRSAPADEFPGLLNRMRDFDHRLRVLIEEGIADKSCAARDPVLAVNWIMGAMSLLPRWYRPGSRLGPDAIAIEFATYARCMLAPSLDLS